MFSVWGHQETVMRLLLIVVGVFAAIVCIEKPAEAQRGGWCAYYNYAFGGQKICGFVTLQQCLADVRGVGGNCSPSPYYQPPYDQRHRRGYPYG
jgi:uncharacterized protein DUF3551